MSSEDTCHNLFLQYYKAWGGAEDYESDNLGFPEFFQRVPQDHEILPAKLREDARSALLERKSMGLLSNSELQEFWYLLERFHSPPTVNGEKFMNYENFRKAAKEASPKAKQYFTASTFAKLLREDEMLSRINILAFFNYVMKKVWLQQTHVGISLYDVCGEGYLREADLENYMLELIPTLCQPNILFLIYYYYYIKFPLPLILFPGVSRIHDEPQPPPPPPHSSDLIHGGQYTGKQSSHQPFDGSSSTNILTNQPSLIGQSNVVQRSSPQISPQSIVITDSNKALPSSVWSVPANSTASSSSSNVAPRVSEPSPRANQKTKAQFDGQSSQSSGGGGGAGASSSSNSSFGLIKSVALSNPICANLLNFSLPSITTSNTVITTGPPRGGGGGSSTTGILSTTVNINNLPTTATGLGGDTPEIQVYKKRFNSEILCASTWGVNLLIGLETGLSLLDRSGEGRVYSLITRRRFARMAVLEGQNILVTISGRKNRVRVYYLSWLRSKIMKTEGCDKKNGWVNVGENLQGAVHFKIVKYEKIKFLVIALRDSVEIYAWAPRPYHKFMAFKRFSELKHRPLLVDLTVEENTRLKVIYGSSSGFHAIDLDSNTVFDLYIPSLINSQITPHCIVVLPNTDGMQLLLCYDTEGVYVDTNGKLTKNVVIQWGEVPTCVAYISTGQLLGWGLKAIEVRSAETGHLDGVFMHKREQKFKFLCERNDKVFFSNTRSGPPQVSMMTLSGIHW
ncbi:unnamed protein product [Trichobilharzia szidati]|nr:unnamed protein product [Trichobilharzia szidati]CAH8834908.1 unnamed protein product [Trichobilharzia szidati]